jgi:PTH1 family peptidyl-tRNA hydrolase
MTLVVVGLGNPGPEYEATRHNAGFRVVDLLAVNLRATYWKDEAGSATALVKVGETDVVLAKPQSFMNVSGGPISKLATAYAVEPTELIVVHDDLDLAPGRVLCKRGGGHGGHNGLRSIHDRLGTDAYLRVRVGVGRPPGRMDPADYVLQRLRGSALEEFEDSIPHAAQAVMHIIERGVDSAMQEYNAE